MIRKERDNEKIIGVVELKPGSYLATEARDFSEFVVKSI